MRIIGVTTLTFQWSRDVIKRGKHNYIVFNHSKS